MAKSEISQTFSYFYVGAKEYTLKAGRALYRGLEIFFDGAAQALKTKKGLEKTASVALNFFAILHANFEESEKYLDELETLFENLKLTKKASGWIFSSEDLIKKDLIDGKKGYLENFLSCTKRICLFVSSIINGCDFAYKMGWMGKISLTIGSIPVKTITRTIAKTITLIKDCLSYNALLNTQANLIIKRSFMDGNRVSQDKIKILKDKLGTFVKLSENYSGSYIELKRMIALGKAKVKVAELEKEYKELFAGEKEALKEAETALFLKIDELKKNISILEGINANERFAKYKLDQFDGTRSSNLQLKFKRLYLDLTCDVVKMITQTISLGKSYFGLPVLMDFFDISLESTAQTILASVSFISADLGFFKFFYDIYSEKEKEEISISTYCRRMDFVQSRG